MDKSGKRSSVAVCSLLLANKIICHRTKREKEQIKRRGKRKRDGKKSHQHSTQNAYQQPIYTIQ